MTDKTLSVIENVGFSHFYVGAAQGRGPAAGAQDTHPPVFLILCQSFAFLSSYLTGPAVRWALEVCLQQTFCAVLTQTSGQAELMENLRS